MRIWILTGAIVLCLLGVAQNTADPALRADRVLVLKRNRTLELFSQGKVLKIYKVALGGDPVGAKTRRVIIKRRREFTFSTPVTRTAGFTSRSISPIPMPGIAPLQSRMAFRPVATCLCMDCPMAGVRWARLTVCETGPTDASPSPTWRLMKSGNWSRMERRSRFGRKALALFRRSFFGDLKGTLRAVLSSERYAQSHPIALLCPACSCGPKPVADP